MKRIWVKLVVAAALMAGCASSPQPFDYHDDRDEKQGPGLFSGDEGGYVIYGEPSEQKPNAEKAPADKE